MLFIRLGVTSYFNENWHNCQEQWAKFHILKNHCFFNSTNNRTESLNQKLKTVIAKYSQLNVFFSTLMNCIGSLAIEKDIRAAEAIMKRPTRVSVFDAHDLKYRNLLTPFAFEKYMTQSEGMNSVTFVDSDDKFAASGPVSNRIITRPLSCDCMFFSSMGIICKHILAFRNHNKMDLFEEATCLKRWTIKHYDAVLSIDYSNDNGDFQTIETQKKRIRKKTHNEKYRTAKKECDTLCSLLAELPEKQFTFALKQLKVFINKIEDGQMPTISESAVSLMSCDSSEENSLNETDETLRMLFEFIQICFLSKNNQ